MQMQMSCGIVICSVIYLCLVGLISAAKCVPEKCGSMEVSYPFWFENSDCGSPGFKIDCRKDEDTGMMAPFMHAFIGRNYSSQTLYHYKIMEIDYMGHLVINSTSLKAESSTVESWQVPAQGPFTISMVNRFVVIGCKTVGTYRYNDWGEGKCVSICVVQNDPPYCRYGCGEITLPNNWKWFNFSGEGLTHLNDIGEVYGFSTIMDPSTFRVVDNETNLFWGVGRRAYYGLRLNWGIGDENCYMGKETANYSCSSNAECLDSPSQKGHVCRCLPGYEGNGYSNGTDCTDIDECSDKQLNKCVGAKDGGRCLNLPGYYNCSCAKGYQGDGYYSGTGCREIDECRQANRSNCVREEEGGICHYLAGSYNCSCTKGFKGDGFRNGTRCIPVKTNKTAMFAAIGSVSASVGISLGVCGLVWWLRKHYQKHARDDNFRRNGGELLETLLQKGAKQTKGKRFRIFSEKDLKDATHNYSDCKKLGGGRSSTTYEGLLRDNTAVAIKKFKEFPIDKKGDESRSEFINEIDILSSLDHKNVVNLIGCCLYTRSPILVHEFVRGGTVSKMLRSFSWQIRLQIALGSAAALAYLHSEVSSTEPILHRDVKSSNILLDHSYTPKLANFGLSWIVSDNDAHLKINLWDTSGYMDPEFSCTGTYTDKSDVYSFGVVLAELLTGREPISTTRPDNDKVLAHCFRSKPFTDILDQHLKNEGNQDQMKAMASLARECLSPKGSERPSMKEVKMKLGEIEDSKILVTSTECLNVISTKFLSVTPTASTDSLIPLTGIDSDLVLHVS